MNIIFLLLTCSIIIALLFLAGFIWSVRSGQYDDAYTPAVRMLFDDPPQDAKPATDRDQSEQSDSES